MKKHLKYIIPFLMIPFLAGCGETTKAGETGSNILNSKFLDANTALSDKAKNKIVSKTTYKDDAESGAIVYSGLIGSGLLVRDNGTNISFSSSYKNSLLKTIASGTAYAAAQVVFGSSPTISAFEINVPSIKYYGLFSAYGDQLFVAEGVGYDDYTSYGITRDSYSVSTNDLGFADCYIEFHYYSSQEKNYITKLYIWNGPDGIKEVVDKSLGTGSLTYPKISLKERGYEEYSYMFDHDEEIISSFKGNSFIGSFECAKANAHFVGKTVFYQETKVVNDYIDDYDYYDLTAKTRNKVVTHKYDLTTGKAEVVDFPYFISNVEEYVDENGKYKIDQIHAYKFREDKSVGDSDYYLMDENLVIHDKLNGATISSFYKIGENYCSLAAGQIYDSNLKTIALFETSKAIVESDFVICESNYYYLVLDSNGKVLFKTPYSSINISTNEFVIFKDANDSLTKVVLNDDSTITASVLDSYDNIFYNNLNNINLYSLGAENASIYFNNEAIMEDLGKASDLTIGGVSEVIFEDSNGTREMLSFPVSTATETVYEMISVKA